MSFHYRKPKTLMTRPPYESLPASEAAAGPGQDVSTSDAGQSPPPDAPFFIVQNAGSGRSSTEEVQQTIAQVLDGAGRKHTFLTVSDPSKLTETARQALKLAQAQQGVVVAAGGDGTLNAVARVVLGSGVPFGILPQGTFNYFGRTYGISQDTERSTRGLLDAVIEPVQVGMLNGQAFLVNASLGLYPTLLEDREAYKQRYGRSRLVALWSGLVTLFRVHRQLRLSMEIEGRPTHLRTPTLVVGNNALQLEQIGIGDPKDLERGKLVAMGPKPVGTWQLYKLLALGLISRLGEAENAFSFNFTKLVVNPQGNRRVKVAMDGEISHVQAPLVFTVAEDRLSLLVPRDESLRERK